MLLIIELNRGLLGSLDFDKGCYKQIIWTLLLARILGDIKSTCAQ